MKKLLLATCILALATSTYAGPGVIGSRHDIPFKYPAAKGVTGEHSDLSGAELDGGKGAEDSNGDGKVNRVCGYCHTPHHANNDGGTALPLWSKNINTTITYTNYTSFTIDGGNDNGDGSQSGDAAFGPSWLCLSCHDGTIAVDQHYNYEFDTTLTGDGYGDAAVGQSGLLDNDHPIGVSMVAAYDAEKVGSDSGLKNPATETFINNDLVGTFTISEFLYANEFVTCASCHDVHNKDTVQGRYMLYAPLDQSDICVSCHNK